MTIDQLVRQLAAEGYVAPDQQSAVAEFLAKPNLTREQHMPWYLRALVGVGAWIAALLLLGFWTSLLWISGSGVMFVLGLVGCGVAAAIYKVGSRNVFVSQLSLAVSLASQVQTAVGMMNISESTTLTLITLLVLEVILIVVHPDAVLRFLGTLTITVALVGLLWTWELNEGLHLLIIGLVAGTALLWEREAEWTVARLDTIARPVGYGTAIALCGLLVVPFIDTGLIHYWWISTVGLLAVLLVQVWRVLRHQGMTGREPFVLALFGGIALMSLPGLHTPGLLAALSILVAGIHRGNRGLAAIAIAFLTLFIGEYYYHLDVTLLIKSLVLLGTGAALLLLRAGLLRYVRWPEVQV